MNNCVNCGVLNGGSGPFQEYFNDVTRRVQFTGDNQHIFRHFMILCIITLIAVYNGQRFHNIRLCH